MMLANALLRLTLRLADPRRREWVAAMAAECDAIGLEHGPRAALHFAWGCFAGALKSLPAHETGRLCLARYILALGVLVPMGVLLLASLAQGSAYWLADAAGAGNVLGSGRLASPLHEGNVSGWLLMGGLTLVLGLGHFVLAWGVLGRQWQRVATLTRLGLSMTATSLIFTGVLFLGDFCAVPQALALAAEAACVGLLLPWQRRIEAHG